MFAAGQIGLNPATMEMEVGVEAQTTRALENVKAILEASGSSLDDALLCNVYLKDLDNYDLVNTIYAKFFTSAAPPGRAAFQVVKLPKDAEIEIQCMAWQRK